ncbi:MAG: hypothetical protein EA401_14795 [Planctomycetota bacterium]|nr:MAG: hypothetical protein EA401_14795 [Planctomycetota bacterium]
MSRVLCTLWVLGSMLVSLAAQDVPIVNPTNNDYTQVPLRIDAGAAQAGAGVMGDTVLPSQWEAGQLWVLADLEKQVRTQIRVDADAQYSGDTALAVHQDGAWIELHNDRIAVRIPATADHGVPAPIAALRHGDGPWMGAGSWRNPPDLEAYQVQVVGSGPVQITVHQDYHFADGQRLRLRLRLRPGRDFVEIEERFDLAPEHAWVFDAGADWTPDASLYTQHGGGAGQPMNTNVQTGSLEPGQARMAQELVFLLPRWSQSMDDGWLAAAADEAMALGAITVRAGQWMWPHEGKIAAELADSADTLRLVMPGINRGLTTDDQGASLPSLAARMWWLRLAPRDDWDTDTARRLVMRHAMADLNKVNRLYILDGFDEGRSGFPHPFRGDQVNPTGFWRQQARQDRNRAGDGKGGFGDLVWAQAVLDPDYYGTPWYGWSMQNPNFWSDVLQRPVFRLSRLVDHPRFDELRELARLAMKMDMHHSITLPGGAGQECPGYQAHAHSIWERIAERTHEALGFDIRQWERHQAGQDFLIRSSQPRGSRRHMLPTGDTHPRGDSGPPRISLGDHDPREWTSEEFPGFGVILRNRPGTDDETFVAIKAGPNRGHYHGDQLALHWVDRRQPLMVDHHVSYNPRAGQEHMHNRLSFGTEDMPWAVIDGHERVLGLATSEAADVMVGEVASTRLRRMPKLPPEEWDQRWDTHELGGSLRYQRAVVLLKGLERDVLVLCDSWQGPQALQTTWNGHVIGEDASVDGAVAQVGDRLTAVRIAPEEASFSRLDWSHDRGGGENTVGLRWSVEAEAGRFITVLWPGDDPPDISAIEGGVRIGDYAVTFAPAFADNPDQPAVRVEHGGSEAVVLNQLDYQRSQGDIGIFVPDAGYPFGPIPAWLASQRLQRPDWAKDLPELLDPMEQW